MATRNGTRTAPRQQEPEPPKETAKEPGNKPVFRVGPIPTSRTEAVACAVWANEVENNGQPFTVYSVQLEARYQSGDEWKSGRSFRGSQLPVAQYCLQKAYEWIMAARDSATRENGSKEVPF